MGGTGVLIWLAGRRGRPRIRGNQPAGRAETILLVGSEGGSTWGFAATLHAALTDAGQSVHAAPMSAFAPERYARAERIIVLAATYGDGDAPASAKGFLDRLAALDRAPDIAAGRARLRRSQLPRLLRLCQGRRGGGQGERLARACCRSTRWTVSRRRISRAGAAHLGQALGIDLELAHQPVLPATETLTLVSRRDYGAEVQAPTAILRFALPRVTLWQRLTGSGLRAFRRGRPARHPARGLAPAASLLARLRAPRRVCRDRGQEAPRRPLFRVS